MAQEMVATIPGKVSQVKIKIGAKVEEDEEALTIEAMKMETPIFIPCNGTVIKVFFKDGDDVDEGDILAIIAGT